MVSLRNHLLIRIKDAFPEAQLTGPAPGPYRVPTNVHICIPGLPTEPLLNALSASGVYISGGSACSSGRFSSVLKALGRKPDEGAFLRLTVGRFNTRDDIDRAVRSMSDIVSDLRKAYAG